VIVSIVVFGTIWAMYHMNHNMILPGGQTGMTH
jgi:heme/copper-type cytochrome/quinol oxidase subunit 4